MEKRISGHTGLLALIGSPVGHSGSPAMYNYSFEKLGLDYAYVAFDIKEDKVKDAIAAMKTFNMRGCNVTMPDKVEAAKYMDELSPAAQIIGAVNTIVNDNGKLTGHITDGEGSRSRVWMWFLCRTEWKKAISSVQISIKQAMKRRKYPLWTSQNRKSSMWSV